MAYMTDEAMDEFAQWQHDSAWETPEAIDPEVIHENDVFDCVHEFGVWTDEFSAWDNRSTFECSTCNYVLEV